MKKINSLIYIIVCVFALVSCEDETDDVSFITSYPTFAMEGEAIISIVKGGSFNDPGITATEGEDEIEVTVEGTVDMAQAGVYVLTYSATNSDGYVGSTTRTVVVTDVDVSGTDLSGAYKRNNVTAPPTNTVTKIVNGYYQASNGSGDGNNLALKFVHTGGTNILIPVQSSQFGRINGTGTLTANGYTCTITFLDPPNTGFSLSRSFTKQ